jgi:hypothetical protein
MRLLLILTAAVVVSIPASGASAASVHHCAPPKGTRAPTAALKAGLKTSCSAARAVARAWDRQCEPWQLSVCHFKAGGRAWGCRATGTFQTHGAPRKTWSNVYVKCGGKETRRGRPSTNFYQAGAVEHCDRPSGTAAQIRFVTGYYAADCNVAGPVAVAWDRACEPGADGSKCEVSAAGRSWTCEQGGRPGIDAVYGYFCSTPGITHGRVSVTFDVRVIPLPPGVPDAG